MCYIDAVYDRQRDRMKIAERVNGKRVLREMQVEHVFYYEHPAGQHKTIFDQPCKRFSTNSSKKMQRKRVELERSKKPPMIFESDIRPEFRHLAKHYMGVDAPVLNVGFFDIEADFHPERGYAPTEDPFNAITGISLHSSATDTLYTLVLCPPTLSPSEATEMVAPKYNDAGELLSGFENTMVFDDEGEMLQTFLDLIEDIDVLSGWNSEGYDIPYMVNRVKRLLGDHEARRFCLWNRPPREKEYLKFGKVFKTYEFVGRVHLDYLLLYQKHNTQQQHSYRLDFIGEIEVGENKTVYEGTLDDLYKKDFYRFVGYNRQDVALLVKIDQKRKFIELANQIAHSNCVLLKTTMGSVALVEQAIINEMHALGYVVPDRKPRDEDSPTAPKAPRPPQFRTVWTKEVDPDLVENILAEYFEGLPTEEREALMATLDARAEEEISEPEVFYQELSGYLEETMPEFMAEVLESCMVEVEVLEAIEEITDEEEDESNAHKGRTPVVGAYVAKPKKGIHYEIACVDINSLYPSAIRALNMSPETIVGQVRPTETMALVKKRISEKVPRAEAWDGIFNLLELDHMHDRSDDRVTVDFEDGSSQEMSGAELYDFIYTPENYLCITANGTIFRTDKDGIIPQLLAKWYAERKKMQGLERNYGDAAKGVEIDEELAALLA